MTADDTSREDDQPVVDDEADDRADDDGVEVDEVDEAVAGDEVESDDGAATDDGATTEPSGTGAKVVDGVGDRDDAVAVAATALRRGDLVVVPTDTVYGVAADAFNPAATSAVFDAKRRQRRFPLPVLIRSPKQLMGLVTAVPETAERLMAAYWPGPLTLVVRADPNLAWELGHNDGTVAVRMPMDDITLDVIRAVGPLATTSANLSGQAAATTVELARSQLGDAVAVYVDGGRRTETQPSTIVDLTRQDPSILRSGPLPDDEVLAVARGEVEPHQAGAPRPRHKPVSPGGPAETTPTDAATVDPGGTAAEPELADDTATGPGPEDAPATTGGAAAAGATAAATRAGGMDDPPWPRGDDTSMDDEADTASTSPARNDAVAVDHRAAAAARSGSTRRTRRRTGGRVVTAPADAAPTDDPAPGPADTTAGEVSTPADADEGPEPTWPERDDAEPDTPPQPPRRRTTTHHIARDHRAPGSS